MIGPSGVPVRVGDDVRVEVQFSEPVYVYLLALNTDGSVQLGLPESEAEPPPPTDRLVLYPNWVDYFTLTEGPGVQAFVAVASRQPLPAYSDWRPGPAALNWGHTEAAGVWRYDGQQFTPDLPSGSGATTGQGDGMRGTKTRRVPEPFEAACRFLRDRTGVDAVEAVAFRVLPKD